MVLMQGVSIGIVYTSLVEAPDLIMNVLGLPSLYFIFVALLLLGAFVAGSIFCIILDKFLTRTIIMFIAFLIMIGGSILMYFLYHFVAHLNSIFSYASYYGYIFWYI